MINLKKEIKKLRKIKTEELNELIEASDQKELLNLKMSFRYFPG